MKLLDRERFESHFTNLGIRVDAVCAKYPTAKYVGQFPLKSTRGEFTDFAADVFYEPNPRVDLGHSNYFAVYVTGGSAYITRADHVENLILSVHTDKAGNYIYSRFQHDFRGFDGNNIDGGYWVEVSGTGKYNMVGRFIGDVFLRPMSVIVKDGEFYQVTDGDIA